MSIVVACGRFAAARATARVAPTKPCETRAALASHRGRPIEQLAAEEAELDRAAGQFEAGALVILDLFAAFIERLADRQAEISTPPLVSQKARKGPQVVWPTCSK